MSCISFLTFPHTGHTIKTHTKLTALVALAVLAGACSDDALPSRVTQPLTAQQTFSIQAAPQATRGEEAFGELSKKVPSSAGFFYDDDGSLIVLVANDAESVEAANELSDLVDRGLVANWRSARPSIRVKKADYSYRQLSAWRNALRAMGRISDLQLRTLDLDEVRNRLVLGVVTASDVQRRAAQALLSQHQIPNDAVVIEIVPAVELDSCHSPDAGTMEEKQRPLEGGRQLSWSNPDACATLGYTALYDGLKYGITNSHVTATLWSVGSPPREFFQGGVPGSRIGVESLDPPPTGQCIIPQGTFDCRGDVSMMRIDDTVQVELGAIARTTSRNGGADVAAPGSKIIDQQRPHFWIRDAIRVAIVAGSQVNKIGRTTGWTWGNVTNTCVDVYSDQPSGYSPFFAGSGNNAVVITCTYIASYYADGGDSGAPIFTWSGDPQTVVMAAGIHWGHATSGVRGYFTPYQEIEGDFGGLNSGRLHVEYPVGRPDIGFSYVDGASPHIRWAAAQNASYYQIDRCIDSQDGVGCLADSPITTIATDYWESRDPAVDGFSLTQYPYGTKYIRYYVTAYAANGVYSGASAYAYFRVSSNGSPY